MMTLTDQGRRRGHDAEAVARGNGEFLFALNVNGWFAVGKK